jgi:hypothetical protein
VPSFLKNTAGGKAISGGALQPRGRRGNTAQVASYWAGGVEELGSYESIAGTVIVGSGGQSAITFTGIPATYKHLQIRGMIRGTGEVRYQLNGDTTANYAWKINMGNNAVIDAGGQANANYSRFFVFQGLTSTANSFGVFVMDILDYANTNKFTTTRVLYGEDDNSNGEAGLGSGLWFNSSAVTSITIYAASSNILEYSHCALYGIKG